MAALRGRAGWETRCVFFFFLQAEEAIRVLPVTGVQTCVLPIWGRARPALKGQAAPAARPPDDDRVWAPAGGGGREWVGDGARGVCVVSQTGCGIRDAGCGSARRDASREIGRAHV